MCFTARAHTGGGGVANQIFNALTQMQTILQSTAAVCYSTAVSANALQTVTEKTAVLF